MTADLLRDPRVPSSTSAFNPDNANAMPKSGNVSEKLPTRERFFLEAMKDRRYMHNPVATLYGVR